MSVFHSCLLSLTPELAPRWALFSAGCGKGLKPGLPGKHGPFFSPPRLLPHPSLPPPSSPSSVS